MSPDICHARTRWSETARDRCWPCIFPRNTQAELSRFFASSWYLDKVFVRTKKWRERFLVEPKAVRIVADKVGHLGSVSVNGLTFSIRVFRDIDPNGFCGRLICLCGWLEVPSPDRVGPKL